ncbi:hypothetical protein F383_20429 [Gossypium arboreum]|uniref:Uncharacterized protein n=1 Tax=Gossypium arboreum TaxID=29729 RepID=A0A0B0NKZ9_GOSAR|nr:hypothetical protein F383_20429 [Gossypium arboreum]
MQFRSCNQDPTLSIPCYYSECHSRSLLAKCPLKIDLYGCTRWGYRGRYFSISFFYFSLSKGPKERNNLKYCMHLD